MSKECSGVWDKVQNVTKEIAKMRRMGYGSKHPALREMYRQRSIAMNQARLGLPRVPSLITTRIGFSPGLIRVWYENETGWSLESRDTPTSTPRYRKLDSETAYKLLETDVNPDLVHTLMLEDTYQGE